MKPFNLQKAKQGKPICTRDGRKARIVCFDRNTENEEGYYPIVALVQEKKNSNNEYTRFYDEKGNYYFGEYSYNLMMVEEIDSLPNSWEEFCENYPVEDAEYFITENSEIEADFDNHRKDIDKNLLRTEAQAKAMLAFIQLIRLRDVYRQGWEPDWNKEDLKYCIYNFMNEIDTQSHDSEMYPLSFQSEEIRDKFLENFRDLIEQAKEFI